MLYLLVVPSVISQNLFENLLCLLITSFVHYTDAMADFSCYLTKKVFNSSQELLCLLTDTTLTDGTLDRLEIK